MAVSISNVLDELGIKTQAELSMPGKLGNNCTITAVIGLIDYQAAYQSWKVDKLDFLACLSSFFGVGVSVFKTLLHATRPNTVSLGNIQGTHIYYLHSSHSLLRLLSTLPTPPTFKKGPTRTKGSRK
ncbi:hypothetical protein SAY86_017914 [Trapa natans]|uniref:Uncharacterized protein n=1 Tax=Trapa natans TaxID=22666 RepID=A0AAN7R729_TRANT|nr:hypothetical protein SAY86_017914 [Trapa natans]